MSSSHIITKSQMYLTLPLNMFDTLVKQALYGSLVWEQPYNGSTWPETHVTTKSRTYSTLPSNTFDTFVKQAFILPPGMSNTHIMT